MSRAECRGVHGGGKGGGGSYTDHFEGMQKIQARERMRVTVFWRFTDFIVSHLCLAAGVKNQNQRPEYEYNVSHLSKKTYNQILDTNER